MPRLPGTNVIVGQNHGTGYVPPPQINQHRYGYSYVPISRPVHSYVQPGYTHVQPGYRQPTCVHQPVYGPTRTQMVSQDIKSAGRSLGNAFNHLVHGHRPRY